MADLTSVAHIWRVSGVAVFSKYLQAALISQILVFCLNSPGFNGLFSITFPSGPTNIPCELSEKLTNLYIPETKLSLEYFLLSKSSTISSLSPFLFLSL